MLHFRLSIGAMLLVAAIGSSSDVAAQNAAPTVAQNPAAPAALPPKAEQLLDLATLEQLAGKDAAKALGMVRDIWTMPIVRGSDGTAVVTIGTLVSGVIMLGLAYLAAGVISRWLAGKLLTRMHLSPSGVAPLQSLSFYVLLAMFTMLSLNILNVPLTVFSFLGGAVAIGAGFGSQNVVSNFISGLILLAERPIRVGDVIELDGLIGSVLHIGARSTKISTSGNREIIVPNSKLLETSVVNWTLSDDVVGCTISVGVAYGSPTREVQRLLLAAAQQQPQVLRPPPPEVLFTDFAADSLMFELRFRVNLRAVKKAEVESDLRFAIDELLADRGIVIAYPQRDVHLNILRPVEVRLAQPSPQLKVA
jgi:small-conductance mechanosensitive channel